MDDKDLIGKFVTVMLTREELEDLPVKGPGEGNRSAWWSVMGEVEGQTSAIGLWLRVFAIFDHTGHRIEEPTSGELLLMPWARMGRVILYESKPDTTGPIGFKHHTN